MAEAAAAEEKARKEAEEERRLKEEHERLEHENKLREERVKAREGSFIPQYTLIFCLQKVTIFRCENLSFYSIEGRESL